VILLAAIPLFEGIAKKYFDIDEAQ